MAASNYRGGQRFDGNPKWKTTPTVELEHYHGDLLRRIEKLTQARTRGDRWAISDRDSGQGDMIARFVPTNEFGRAVAGLNQVARILPDVEAEVKGR